VSAPTVDVPDTIEELLTPRWLNAALAPRFPGVNVTEVTPGPVVERMSTNARFRIECSPEPPPGLSPALCAKGYFSEVGHTLSGVGVPEACFYRDLADDVGVHTLRSVWADVHPVTQHGVVITEDVIEAGGDFLDALSPYSVEQTARTLGEFACLHAYAWDDPSRVDAPWLASRVGHTLGVRGVREIGGNFEGPNGVGVPDEIRDPQLLVDAFGMLALRTPGPGWTVIHGDAHVGNVFVDGDGRPGLVDWQLVQHGHWSIDVGYHIASALEPAERAAAERDLLTHYLDRLRAEGVSPPSFDEAWAEYRRGVAYGFFLWGITLYVQPDIIQALLRRLGTAVYELESYAMLQVV
jgi:Phosphotransferase enzyme family